MQPSTSISLLKRLHGPEYAGAWGRFVDLYTPLLYAWALRIEEESHAAADLVQDVFLVLVREMQHFSYQEQGSFRAWLKTVMLNHWRAGLRRRKLPSPLMGSDQLAGTPDPREPADFAEEDYRRHLVARAMDLMQCEFQPQTWKACWESVVEDRSVEDVAREFGMTPNAVYLAKSRVLRRLRQELEGLL